MGVPQVLLLLKAVSCDLSPGVEGFGVVFIQLVGAGINDFVFRQTVLSSAGGQLLLQRIAAGLWGLQLSLPLVTPVFRGHAHLHVPSRHLLDIAAATSA